MNWSDLPLNPSTRMLRQFAGLCLVLLGGLAAWDWIGRSEPLTAAALGVTAVGVGALGLVAPRAVRPIFVASVVLTFPIGWVVSRVMLVLLFAVVITPVGLLFRVRRRDALGLARRPDRTTYWSPKPAAPDVASYFRQF